MANGTEIGKAFVHIVPTFKGVVGALQQGLVPGAEQAGKAVGTSMAAKMKQALVALGIGKILGDTVKASLQVGGALQQSFGGLETLYGDAADAAKNYAMQAAQAGIDANTYAEQAVSFGAALKQAFGGDTEAAMNAANTAILDMADNSAKMGTDIGSIQTAYQGFAKQNYTMLDNLKLGYGGTRSEMERLLKDASKLSGVEYNIDNLGDVYAAIHVIQEELGVAGVAAKEAGETMTGSAAATKAAWQNLLASMSLGMDLSQPIQQLVTSAGNLLFNNLIPMVGNVLLAMPQVVIGVAQQIFPTIQAGISALLSGQVGQTVTTLTAGFMARIPELMATGVQMLTGFVTGLYNALPQIVVAAAGVIAQFVATVAVHLPEILQKGIELLGQLAAGIIQAIPDLVRKIPEVYNSIKQQFSQFDWLSIGGDIVKGIANGITNGLSSIAEAARNAAESALNTAKNALGIHSPSRVFEQEVGKQISAGMALGISNNAYQVEDAINGVGKDIAGFGVGKLTATPNRVGYGGFEQNITINSPTELSPFEVARQTRNATQQMALTMAGVY